MEKLHILFGVLIVSGVVLCYVMIKIMFTNKQISTTEFVLLIIFMAVLSVDLLVIDKIEGNESTEEVEKTKEEVENIVGYKIKKYTVEYYEVLPVLNKKEDKESKKEVE